jgi:GT2 family glycosyltransferase
MKVSLITVTYNSEKYLTQALTSRAYRDFSDIEYIIIDGSSAMVHQHIRTNADVITKWLPKKMMACTTPSTKA